MKVCIVGGSAASTPSLFRHATLKHVLDAIDFTLLGRSDVHLSGVERAARLVCDDPRLSLRTAGLGSEALRPALTGADIVLVQVRFGGNAARGFDETFPTRYGIPGDEGLGPGGLSAAWRSWPELLSLLDAVADACPAALILLLTSPVSLLIRCIRTARPHLRVAGICELPWTTLRTICEAAGADPEEASFTYGGVNHLGWFRSVRVGEMDVLSAYAAAREEGDGFPSSVRIDACGGVPLKYLRLHYERALVAAEQAAAGRSRGAELEAMQSAALARYLVAGREEIEAILDRRPAPWYEHAVAPLLASLASAAPSRIPFFLSVQCGGLLEGFDDGDILEIAHRSDGTALDPVAASCDISEPARADLERFVRYERAAARAVIERSRDGLADALTVHPWVSDGAVARAAADDMLRFADQADRTTAATSVR